MKTIASVEAWQEHRRDLRGTIGFVPTMGALHPGHAALLQRCRAENDVSVLSIYLNPTQFNNPDDLSRYPCTLEQDLELASRLGVDVVLLPSYEDLYPDGFRFRVEEHQFSHELCGAHRPGHFTGVLTVVMKLLNLVRPRRAYFGEKDFQQLQLITDMCGAFFLDVDIVPCATVREADGLALSSRNAVLDANGRARAPEFHRLLESDLDDEGVRVALERAGFTVDYVETRYGRRLGAIVVDCGDRQVRLIDNVPLSGADRAETAASG